MPEALWNMTASVNTLKYAVTFSLLGNIFSPFFFKWKRTFYLLRVLTLWPYNSRVNMLAHLFQRAFTMLPLRGRKASNAVISALNNSRRDREKLCGTLDSLCNVTSCSFFEGKKIYILYLETPWYIINVVSAGDHCCCFSISLLLTPA